MSTSSPTAMATLGGEPEPLIPMACRVKRPNALAPFIALTIAGRKFAALLDSGASATLFGDDVLAHLHRRAIRLRACDITFHLASGKANSGGSARLVVRWEKRVRRHRFVHLPGLTVPVILGRDFLARTGIVIDIANGGYRQGVHAALLPFAKLADVSEAPPAPNTSRARGNNATLSETLCAPEAARAGREAMSPTRAAAAATVARRARLALPRARAGAHRISRRPTHPPIAQRKEGSPEGTAATPRRIPGNPPYRPCRQ